jgi:uncharacterized membrane protein
MASEGTKHLFVLSFPEQAAAEAAVGELHELERDMFIKLGDYAIVTKAPGGKLSIQESKDADPGAQRGAVAGGLGAAFVALAATPIGAGAIVVGAGIGAVTAALRDSGFKSKDLEEVGRLMEDGRSALIFAVQPEETDRLRKALADIPEFRDARRADFEVSGDSKHQLRQALDQYRAETAKEGATEAP